jgi:hypothetical protein
MLRAPLVLALLVALFPPPTAAGEKVEVIPFLGYRFGGSLTAAQTGESYNLDSSASYGLVVDIPLGDGTSMLELLWSRQDTEVRTGSIFEEADRFGLLIDSYQVGVVHELDDQQVRPFVTASLGATRFAVDRGSVSDSTVFSFTAGGGAKILFGEHVGIRLDGRLYAPFVSGSAGVVCGGGGGGGSCFLSFNGTVLWQIEATAGLIVVF